MVVLTSGEVRYATQLSHVITLHGKLVNFNSGQTIHLCIDYEPVLRFTDRVCIENAFSTNYQPKFVENCATSIKSGTAGYHFIFVQVLGKIFYPFVAPESSYFCTGIINQNESNFLMNASLQETEIYTKNRRESSMIDRETLLYFLRLFGYERWAVLLYFRTPNEIIYVRMCHLRLRDQSQ